MKALSANGPESWRIDRSEAALLSGGQCCLSQSRAKSIYLRLCTAGAVNEWYEFHYNIPSGGRKACICFVENLSFGGVPYPESRNWTVDHIGEDSIVACMHCRWWGATPGGQVFMVFRRGRGKGWDHFLASRMLPEKYEFNNRMKDIRI